MLTAFEREGKRLVQIILCGQPMLLNTLKTEPMYALNERITRRVVLTPLSDAEVEAYIYHRLSIAGGGDKIGVRAGCAAADRGPLTRAASPRERARGSHAAGRPHRRRRAHHRGAGQTRRAGARRRHRRAATAADSRVTETESADTIDLSGDALSLAIGSERGEIGASGCWPALAAFTHHRWARRLLVLRERGC